jgi:hypothetical protein
MQMIKTERTRFILDGKVVEEVTHANVSYCESASELTVNISKDGGVTYETGTLLGIEVVDNKEHFKDESGETWTQFICASVK